MTLAGTRKVTSCRACDGALSIPFCDLGSQPLANTYVNPKDRESADPVFPLAVGVCEQCKLAQLHYIVDPGAIFQNYAYLSSVSAEWLAHARLFCNTITSRLELSERSFVVEVASNDGYLLRNFVSSGIPCLGIEPAANVAKIAVAAGVPTKVCFFGLGEARALVDERGRTADLVIANNVLAHVPDLHDFLGGLSLLIGETGILSIEVPHLTSLVKGAQFDTIYHEHYAYWSLLACERVLAEHELSVFDAEHLSTHGGSLRLYARRASRSLTISPGLLAIRAEEEAAGVNTLDFYSGFEPRVRAIITSFQRYLEKARAEGRRVAAYGAAAKGNTFLNAAGITAADILAVGDANPLKQGHLLPGSRVPIISPEAMLNLCADDIVILPWNIAGEIRRALTAKGWSGRFVTGIPALAIYEGQLAS